MELREDLITIQEAVSGLAGGRWVVFGGGGEAFCFFKCFVRKEEENTFKKTFF